MSDHRPVPKLQRETIIPEPRQRGLVIAALCLVAGTMLTLGIAPVLIATAADRATTCEARDVSGAKVAWLGVRVRSHPQGARVLEPLPHSPAADVGIRRGDVITAVQPASFGEGHVLGVSSSTDLVRRIRSMAPGDDVVVHVRRNSRSLRLPVTLDAMAVESLCRHR